MSMTETATSKQVLFRGMGKGRNWFFLPPPPPPPPPPSTGSPAGPINWTLSNVFLAAATFLHVPSHAQTTVDDDDDDDDRKRGG